MTQPDPGRDTRIVDIKGRNVVVRQLTDAQSILMLREARLLQRNEADTSRMFSAVSRMYDILESAVVQEEDKEYLLDLVTAGDLELRDMLVMLTVFGEDKPKVRRGRPRKTVA